MSYANQLTEQIHTVLDRLTADGAEWRPALIADEVVRSHDAGLAEGDDALFWRHCGYAETRREVTRCINARAGDRPTGDSDPQFVFPGYQHLQRYYVVQRDGEDMGVPVFEMTDLEIESKVALYRAQARAQLAHANELIEYRAARRKSTA